MNCPTANVSPGHYSFSKTGCTPDTKGTLFQRKTVLCACCCRFFFKYEKLYMQTILLPGILNYYGQELKFDSIQTWRKWALLCKIFQLKSDYFLINLLFLWHSGHQDRICENKSDKDPGNSQMSNFRQQPGMSLLNWPPAAINYRNKAGLKTGPLPGFYQCLIFLAIYSISGLQINFQPASVRSAAVQNPGNYPIDIYSFLSPKVPDPG